MNLTAEVERIDATTVVVKLTGRMNLGMRLHEVESTINKLAWDGTKKPGRASQATARRLCAHLYEFHSDDRS